MTGKFRFAVQASCLVLSLGLAGGAYAQSAPAADEKATEIVVTGSSLKGVAPVGSNLTTIGHAQIEDTAAQTVQQILKSSPAVTGNLAPSQGGYGSSDASGSNAPTIHGLGASASNSTLVLMNGHRLPTTGANHVLVDPNIIPPIALERVEVLADGASSVYGSDAVAGVVNFITRKNVNALEADAQKGFGDQYNTFNAQALFGKTWDTGSFLAAYSYSNRSSLSALSRPYSNSMNLTPFGGTNQTSNKCTVLTQASATSITGTSCNPTNWDLIPKEVRHTAYMAFRQDIGEKLHLMADFDYSSRSTTQAVSRGGVSATIFGTAYAGSLVPAGFPTASYSINPNFSGTKATVNFDGDALYGPGAVSIGTAEDFYGHIDLTYDLTPKWSVNLGGLIGRDRSEIISQGTLNSATFNLAVNGFTSAVINGVPQFSQQSLSLANAFNPLNPSATSAATQAALIDSNTYYTTHQTLRNAYLKVSGDLVKLPGGVAKLAVGGELLGYSIDQSHTALNGLGGATLNSIYVPLHYGRQVASAYGELYLPLVKDGFVKSIDVSLSGRYDHYSDFGNTTNPKVAANFEPVKGIKFRANWSKSFVAPSLMSIGVNSYGQTGESAFTYGAGSTVPGGLAAVPIATYPNVELISGALISGSTTLACNAANVASTGATTCSLNNVQGAVISGGQHGLKPQTGTDFSIGVDLTPVQVPGLRISVTYWSDKLRNGITAPQSVYAFSAASLSNLLTLYPGGATTGPNSQISAAQGPLIQSGASATAFWTYNYQQNNVLNLNVAGIDFEAMYHAHTDAGNFTIVGSFTRKTKFEQWFGSTGTHFSVLGTTGFNTTFPSLKFEGRAMVGWNKGPFNIVESVNYEGPYKWWGSTPIPTVTKVNGVPTGGGEPVSGFLTFDLHAAYSFEHLSLLKKANFYVDASNLFNKYPPFINAAANNGAVGYDSFAASPIGRVISIGLRTKF